MVSLNGNLFTNDVPVLGLNIFYSKEKDWVWHKTHTGTYVIVSVLCTSSIVQFTSTRTTTLDFIIYVLVV